MTQATKSNADELQSLADSWAERPDAPPPPIGGGADTETLRAEFAAADNTLRTEFATADNTVRSQFAAADTAIRSEFANADNTVRGQFATADNTVRTEFAAVDTAIRSEFAAADNTVRSQFAAADTAVRTEFAAVDTTIRSEFAAADNTVRGQFAAADTAVRGEFAAADTTLAAADTTIRSEFAAADTAVRASFATVDTAIRSEFAAADTALAALITANTDAVRVAELRSRSAQPPMRIPATVIERFQSGHGWGSATGVTQTSNDTTVLGLGTQSMKLVTQANTFGFTRKTALTSQDLSTRHPRLWLTVEDITQWGSGSITVLAAPTTGLTTSSYFSWQINADTVAASLSNAVMMDPGKMVCIDLPWAAVFTTGTPAKTAITDWQVNINASNTAGLNLWLNGIDLVSNLPAKYPAGVVTIALDDTYQGHWDFARPALAKYGYPAHAFPIISSIGQTGSMTLAQFKSAQDVLGWEVGAHAMTTTVHDGYGSLTAAQIEADMLANRDWLTDNGFRSSSYAYPLGTFTQQSQDAIAARLFRSARSINPSVIGALPPSNPYRLRSRSGVGGSGGFGVTTSGTTGTYGLLNAAKAGTGWVVLTIHNITTAASANINTISAADFTSLIDSINTLGMEVATITQVLDNVRNG